MIIKNAELEIKLCSDLCSGSGFSYAGVIDQDVTYDEYGFPYIPAKRIKGCMREAAQLVCKCSTIDKLFGERETGRCGRMEIGNAVLKQEEQMIDELKKARATEDLKEYVKTEDVLDLYTSVRAQTKVEKETGSAVENTLRFTRVVNKFDPFKEPTKEGDGYLCFYSPIRCFVTSEDEWKLLVKDIEYIACATRNIGMNRNRGLGSVSCKIILKPDDISESKDLVKHETLPDGQVKLSYMIENTEPLILSEKDKNDTATFIGGKSILGLLAGEYIRKKENEGVKKSGDANEFADLFLNGTVKYANITPAISGERSFPVPLYFNQLKLTKEYVNLLIDKDDEDIDKTESGNQPKKIKGKYIVESEDAKNEGDNSYLIVEPEKELAFHHRHKHGDDDEQLYNMGILAKGQKFVGEIYINSKDSETNEAYARVLTELLTHSNLHFGKSKTSQYGSCKLIKLPEDRRENSDQFVFNAGDEIVVTLKSDALFVDEDGNYTIYFDQVKDLLAGEIGGEGGTIYDKNETDQKSIIDTTEILGYNTKWNMKRPAAPAIKAGSAFVYKLKTDLKRWPKFVGERTQEGFGEIGIQKISGRRSRVECKEEEESTSELCPPLSEDLQTVICHSLREKIIEELLLVDMPDPDTDEHSQNKSCNLNSSNIGRLTLMLKESIDKNKHNPDQAATDFGYRIQSIKSKDFRERAIDFIEEGLKRTKNASNNPKAVNPLKPKERVAYKIDCEEIIDHLKDSNLKTWLLGIVKEDQEDNVKIWLTRGKIEALFKELWGDYLLQRLTLMKYQKKGEGESHD